MKILYATDIHGHTGSYDTILERAARAGAEAIVYGGDLHPLGQDLFGVQRDFLQGFLPDYLERCSRAGVAFLSTLGNMDLRAHDSLFREVMGNAGNAHSLLEEKAELGGYCFIGSAMTTDGPFRLKDRCLRDTPGSDTSSARQDCLLSDGEGLHERGDWPSHLRSLPSLAEHLGGLPSPCDPPATVYVLHQPPAGHGLGVIDSGADVGSAAVESFLEASEARLSLHGHIHESPSVSGRWRSRIGRTTAVQPGQQTGESCVSVLIDLDTLGMERST